jgi:hypothetical protein
MRRAANIDANQPDIVCALRAAGASVQPLHFVGSGCPDVLVGIRGKNLLMEIKDGAKVLSRRKLTADEIKWHAAWRGQKAVVESVEQALAVLASV